MIKQAMTARQINKIRNGKGEPRNKGKGKAHVTGINYVGRRIGEVWQRE